MSDYLGPHVYEEEECDCATVLTEMATHPMLILCNVSGVKFQVRTASAVHFPSTRLGKLAAALLSSPAADEGPKPEAYCDLFDKNSNEYYFDRSNFVFDAILNLYRNGAIHIPDGICLEVFLQELEYWDVEKSYIAPCCQVKLRFLEGKQKNQAETLKRLSTVLSIPLLDEVETIMQAELHCDAQCLPLFRKKLWLTLEDPKSSKLAVVYTGISMCFVLSTVLVMILSSIPSFQVVGVSNSSNETEVIFGLEIADTTCVAWFTVEHFIRIWAAPNRLAYLKSPLCNIDFFAIAPFYVELLFDTIGVQSKFFGDLRRSLVMMRILRAFRVLRVLRVLKVARYSKGFQSVGSTFRKCWKELLMLVLFMFTTNIIFATAMFFIENESKTPGFESIPAASYWCIITMTTVGFGDVVPVTILGKIFAGLVSISGIVLLAFPISVIVDHFHEEYGGEQPPPPVQQPQSMQRDVSIISETSPETPLLPHCYRFVNGMLMMEPVAEPPPKRHHRLRGRI